MSTYQRYLDDKLLNKDDYHRYLVLILDCTILLLESCDCEQNVNVSISSITKQKS